MHMSLLIIAPEGENPIEYVDQVMAPYQEGKERGFWDWYVIGGRWSGYLNKYSKGKSKPTVNRDTYLKTGYPDDIQPLKNFTKAQLKKLTTYSAFVDGYAAHSEAWSGAAWLKDEKWSEAYYSRFLEDRNPGDNLIIVDYHN